MKKSLLTIILFFTSNLFSIELTDVPGYQTGTWETKSVMIMAHPNQIASVTINMISECKKSDDQKFLLINTKAMGNGETYNYNYKIDLTKKNDGSYNYVYTNNALNIKTHGEIYVLSKEKVKQTTQEDGSYTIIHTTKHSEKYAEYIAGHYNQSNFETNRSHSFSYKK